MYNLKCCLYKLGNSVGVKLVKNVLIPEEKEGVDKVVAATL